MERAIIYAMAWAGLCSLFDYSMWEGNILSDYWEWLDKKKCSLYKIFGLCIPCFCAWFGMWFIFYDYANYFIFLGISELLILLIHQLKIITNNLNK